MLNISVIIPTFNEEKLLPLLLESLKLQKNQPLEIIVADNNSNDRTVEIAKDYGVKITEGGSVSEGRNNGFKESTSDTVLFLDADVILPDNEFLERSYNEFVNCGADVVSCYLEADSDASKKMHVKAMFIGYNVLKKFGNIIKDPITESGCFMFVKRKVFESLTGFSLKAEGIAEDLEFSRRAVKMGYKHYVIKTKVITSARRVDTKRKVVKTLFAASLMFLFCVFGLYNRKKISDFLRKLYGKLGG